MDEKNLAVGVPSALPQISPEEVHKNITRCFKLRNRVDTKMLSWILILMEKRFSRALGAKLPVHYVMHHLQYEKSEAYEILNVAWAIPNIPLSLAAFERGEISWSKLKQIARVAGKDTDAAWLAFAKTHKPGELKAEVRDALNSKRKSPRKDGRGISNITVDQKLRLTLEQQQIYQRAMEKVAAVAKEARSTGGLLGDEEVHRISPEEAMTFLCQRILETDDLLGKLREGSERDRAIYDLIFRTCPDCHASHILTDDGPVEVPHDHVKAIEKKARKVELKAEELMKGEILPRGMINDLAIPKDVELKVLARDKRRCASCFSPIQLHLHHVVFRSKGGPNEVWNLITTCQGCHSCIHGGTLEAFMDSAGEVSFKPRGDRIEAVLGEELKEYVTIPSVTIVIGDRTEPERCTKQAGLSEDAKGVMKALRKIGYDQEEARERVFKALRLLSNLGRAPTGDEIIEVAVHGRLIEREEKLRRCGKSAPANGTGREKAPPTIEKPPSGDLK